MITRTTRACFAAALLCLLPALAGAIDLPAQGATMDQVRKTWGSPAADLGAVGSPAITRWVYDQFTVYFEGRRVIHAVLTQPLSANAPQPSALPASAPTPVMPVAPVKPAPAAPAVVPPPPPPPPAPTATALAPAAAPAVVPAAPAPVAPSAPVAAAPPPAQPAAAPVPAPKPAASGFHFDPVSGRLIVESEESTSSPAAVPPSGAVREESAAGPDNKPAATPPSGGSAGNALDGELVFDPETGTFRPKQ